MPQSKQQPFLDTKRQRKPIKPNKHVEQTYEKHQDQPFPPQASQSQHQKVRKTQEQNTTRQDIRQVAP